MAENTRLDRALVERGLATSRTQAARWIEQGRVCVNGVVVTKNSVKVSPEQRLHVVPGQTAEYVSRAGHKLAGALEIFSDISVRGKRCLDAGASTGGFTDVLLRAGADHVVAADVGHGQLVTSLRQDPRVSVFEGFNVRYMSPEDIGGPVELTVCDVSFISLTLILGALAKATAPGGDLVVMVKPQFEVGAHRVGRSGVVTSQAQRQEAVDGVAQVAADLGLTERGRVRSSLPGQDGNQEFFLWLS